MANPITALFAYRPSVGTAALIAQYQGRLWRFDGTNQSPIGGVGVPYTGNTFMVQAQDYVYATGGTGQVVRTDGIIATTLSIINPNTQDVIENVSDMLWMRDRMWYAVGDLLYFSEAGQPEEIRFPPLRVRKGSGDQIIRLVAYRDGYILVFKADGRGNGSVSVVDTGDNQANSFRQGPRPLFDSMSIVAPRCIIRAGTDEMSDLFFLSREGLRTLKITSLDKLTGANLPISLNLKTVTDSINYDAIGTSFAEVFDDELLLWVPTVANQLPDTCLGYSLKVPKQSIQQGWTVMDMMPAASAAVIGFTGKPSLYLGENDGGIISKAFGVKGDCEYREISRRITFSNPAANYDARDKTPFKFFLFLDRGTVGTMEISLIMEDNREFPLAAQTALPSGAVLPQTTPFTLGLGSIVTAASDAHYSGTELIERFKDCRIKITSTGFPRILGWEFLAHLEAARFNDWKADETEPNPVGTLAQDSVTPGAIEPI